MFYWNWEQEIIWMSFLRLSVGKVGLIFQLSSIIKYLYLHKMDIFNLSLHLYKKVLPTTIYENNLCKIHLFNFLWFSVSIPKSFRIIDTKKSFTKYQFTILNGIKLYITVGHKHKLKQFLRSSKNNLHILCISCAKLSTFNCDNEISLDCGFENKIKLSSLHTTLARKFEITTPSRTVFIHQRQWRRYRGVCI